MTTKQNIQRVAHHKHLISANGCLSVFESSKVHYMLWQIFVNIFGAFCICLDMYTPKPKGIAVVLPGTWWISVDWLLKSF